jgi:hypothetical protein
MAFPFLYADISKLEAAIGLPKDFIGNLMEEDDWSFVIKSHSIVEAALAHLLGSVSDARLAKLFRRLPLAGPASKLAALEAIDALDAPTRGLIARLAKLRNDLVHDVSYLSFTFEQQLASHDRHDLAELISQVVAGPEWKQFIPIVEEGLRTMPKPTLAVGVTGILAKALFKLDPSEQQRAAAQAKESEGIVALFGILLILILAATRRKGEN